MVGRGPHNCCVALAVAGGALLLLGISNVESFQPVPGGASASRCRVRLMSSSSFLNEVELKQQLAEYLRKREESNADDLAKAEVGKVIGGTRGNALLELVSVAPNKERVQEEAPEIFDYSELSKYGYSHLVTTIIESGGRREMYRLMDLPEPSTPDRIAKPQKPPPKLVIDRIGSDDDARFSGLSMAMDDDTMGKALEEASRKVKKGESLRKRLVEEDYVLPYADSKNVGPRQTPLLTPEELDRAVRQRGDVMMRAKNERAAELKKDTNEILTVEGELRAYSVLAAVTCALAYGGATPVAFAMLGLEPDGGALELLKIPALGFLAASVGSTVVNASVLAPSKNRSSLTWGVKGLMGGPLAIRQLRELDDLKTFREIGEERATG